MFRSYCRPVVASAVAAYALAAIAGLELHSLTHRHAGSAGVAEATHDCGCGHCHAQPAPQAAPAESGSAAASSPAPGADSCEGHCAVCAGLHSLRLGRTLAAPLEIATAGSAPAFLVADVFDVPHVVVATDARGPPVC
ncbi:MAG: hypothetical protein KF688_02220 [Pirellulales bacterium]|nr:hypothetical protein [Pirellulales bacterium]